jgi:3D (Asp-Asp-Asp) domain-containing protein
MPMRMYSRTGRIIRPSPWRQALCAVFLLCIAGATGCVSGPHEVSPVVGPTQPATYSMEVEASGYCSCGECCGWRRSLLGTPVSKSTGKRKAVGVTASGTRARPGTIAADTRVFPFGTVLYVPGYGYGRVEDRGSSMVGNKIDLFFPSHRQALEWGRKRVRALVWPVKPAAAAKATSAGRAR